MKRKFIMFARKDDCLVTMVLFGTQEQIDSVICDYNDNDVFDEIIQCIEYDDIEVYGNVFERYGGL